MVRSAGKNRDTYDTVNTPLAITLNTATYTTVLSPEPNRLGYTITNDNAQDVFVKEKAAGDPDSADRGFTIFKRSVYESPESPVAIGEISCKAASGSPSVLVMEK